MRPVSRVSFLPPHITSWLCISNIWLAALSHAGSPIAASFPSDRAGAQHSAPDAKRPPFGGRPHYLRRPSFAISSLSRFAPLHLRYSTRLRRLFTRITHSGESGVGTGGGRNSRSLWSPSYIH